MIFFLQFLNRSVLICNTLRRIEAEFVEDGIPLRPAHASSSPASSPRLQPSFTSGPGASPQLADLDPLPSSPPPTPQPSTLCPDMGFNSNQDQTSPLKGD